MTDLSIDLETRSTVDLRTSGTYPYAAHASTDVWCMAWAVAGEEPKLWVPGDPFPEEIIEHIAWGGPLRAWNAPFERIMWNLLLVPRYHFPEVPLDQWVCTMAEALSVGLPGALGKAAKVLGVSDKDDKGRRLMLQMSKPRKRRKSDGDALGPFWWDDEERRERLYEYCRQDVRVEMECAASLRRLSKAERRVWLMTERMNDRGVALDVPLIRGARKVVETGQALANDRLQELTAGAVDRVTDINGLKAWLAEFVDIDNLRKDTVRDLLDDDLPVDVADVLGIRRDFGKSSVKKLDAMLAYGAWDGRMHGALQYHGAHTGRFAGRGPQPQNLPRGEVIVDDLLEDIQEGDYAFLALDNPPAVAVSSALRKMFVAGEGRLFYAADFAQIEARVLAWLAGQDDLVEAFARGSKIYEEMAASIYDVPVGAVTPQQRQVGKNCILGAGFQCGPRRFAEMVQEQSGVVLDRGARDDKGNLLPGEVDMAEKAIKQGYRAKYDRIPALWYELQDAAMQAVQDEGAVVRTADGRIRYTYRNQFLWCRLPSGRLIAYPLPAIRMQRSKIVNEFTGEVTYTARRPTLTAATVHNGQWVRRGMYGGLLTENVVQAIARDVMVEAMLRLEETGYTPVLTVHDETVCEVKPDADFEKFMELMIEVPDWAAGLPVKAEGWRGRRYRK